MHLISYVNFEKKQHVDLLQDMVKEKLAVLKKDAPKYEVECTVAIIRQTAQTPFLVRIVCDEPSFLFGVACDFGQEMQKRKQATMQTETQQPKPETMTPQQMDEIIHQELKSVYKLCKYEPAPANFDQWLETLSPEKRADIVQNYNWQTAWQKLFAYTHWYLQKHNKKEIDGILQMVLMPEVYMRYRLNQFTM